MHSYRAGPSRAFGGKTFSLSLLALTEALILPVDVTVLGGSGQQSARVNGSILDISMDNCAPSRMSALGVPERHDPWEYTGNVHLSCLIAPSGF